MFELISDFKPSGDQPQAIEKLVTGLNSDEKHQVLLGATGTGKTFTIANVIAKTNKPTLIMAHNKTLAGQLYSELKEFFPNNHVEYFVSYYDYYQPEAYVPSTDTYIEKDSSINDEIDELRHAATSSLINYRDTIVVASVSCIYNIGDVETYTNSMMTISVGDKISRNKILEKLINMTYERSEIDFHRGTFRAKGDVIEIIPSYERANGVRIELFGEEVERIATFEVVTGRIIQSKKTISIFPASHFVVSENNIKEAVKNIKEELEERLQFFKDNNKLLEEQRLRERVNYDMEMLLETGFCHGVENYSRHLAFRKEGETPNTLMDFFAKDYLLVIDESHATLPQVRGMYNGDRSRKQTLVDYGFRLPSALDNRPLKFEEFTLKTNQTIYVSATPGDYELELVNNKIIEQIIRPTWLLDPTIEIKPTKNQIDDLINEISSRKKQNERVLITTLTIRMAEELTSYLKDLNLKVAYLHSEVKTLDRVKIIHDLRVGIYDVLVGINLLREGLDLPEVSLICIMDADKQGFLRSERSLIQTIGRCSRNINGHVIMYADNISEAMKLAIDETNRRRNIQEQYNIKHNIIPKTIIKAVRDVITNDLKDGKAKEKLSKQEKAQLLNNIENEMKEAARNYDFERAIELRDILFEIKSE